jgi:asparagine synthase (glutamine-hydrolysing)
MGIASLPTMKVYNFQEMRIELESVGHRFKSKTDTEVILQAYVHWGAECLKHFNGMFAFVIWDRTKQELFVARDRYGIKPLYYCIVENTLIIASEQKAIIEHPAVQRKSIWRGSLNTLPFKIYSQTTLFLKA